MQLPALCTCLRLLPEATTIRQLSKCKFVLYMHFQRVLYAWCHSNNVDDTTQTHHHGCMCTPGEGEEVLLARQAHRPAQWGHALLPCGSGILAGSNDPDESCWTQLLGNVSSISLYHWFYLCYTVGWWGALK